MAEAPDTAAAPQGQLAHARIVGLPAMDWVLLLKLGTVYIFGLLLIIGMPADSSLLMPAIALGVAFALGAFVAFQLVAYEHGWGAFRIVTVSALGVRLEAAGVHAPALRIGRDQISSVYVDDQRIRLLDSRSRLLLEIDDAVIGSSPARKEVADAIATHLPAVRRVALGRSARTARTPTKKRSVDPEE